MWVLGLKLERRIFREIKTQLNYSTGGKYVKYASYIRSNEDVYIYIYICYPYVQKIFVSSQLFHLMNSNLFAPNLL